MFPDLNIYLHILTYIMVLVITETPLSKRGSELSVLGSRFEQFKAIFGDLYDPDTNPDGIVNLGVSENVTVPSLLRRILRREDLDNASANFRYF